MRVLLDVHGAAVELPPEWVAVSFTVPGGVQVVYLGYRAAVTPTYDGITASHSGHDLGLMLYPRPTGTSLEELAEAQIRRNVGQGRPERGAGRAGDRVALAYGWTDGVLRIQSWFLEHGPAAFLRIDRRHRPGLVEGEGHAARAAAAELLDRLVPGLVAIELL